MLTVLPPDMITTDREMIEIRKEPMQKQLVDPYQAIIDTADSKGCDLIVMASHGRRGISAIVAARQSRSSRIARSRC
jgi:nucleotide-binding universal stress UspA family protein